MESQYLTNLLSLTKLPQSEAQLRLAERLDLNPINNPLISQLQSALQNYSDQKLSQLVENVQFFNGDWPGFDELVCTFLKYCRDVNPWSIEESFDLINNFFSDLSVAFINTRGVVLVSIVVKTAMIAISVGKVADYKLDPRSKPRLTFISSIVLKFFNNIRAGREANNKKSILLFISTHLCKLYFQIGNPLLCNNVFSNMSNSGLSFTAYPKAQQVEYRFLLGKFYLIKNQLPDAFFHLNWSYNNCLISSKKNLEIILHHLVPVGILMGKLPGSNVLRSLASLSIYVPLIHHLKKGDIYNCMSYIHENQLFFQQKGLLVLLVQRLRILLIRNLVFKTYVMLGQPKRIHFNHIYYSLVVSIQPTNYLRRFSNEPLFMFFLDENSFNDEFVENVLISLLDQNLIKGKLFSSGKSVSLPSNGVFNNIFKVYTTRFPLSSSDNWIG